MTTVPCVLTPPAPPAPETSERDFLQLVIDYARALGYRCYHPLRSEGSEAGWPDLTIVGHGRLIFAELKTRTGRLSPAQREWGWALTQAGQAWHCWRPGDWAEILDVLGDVLGGAPGEQEG